MERNYKIYLWCGCGYELSGPFEVTAFSENHALEVLSAKLISEGLKGFYETEEEHKKKRSFWVSPRMKNWTGTTGGTMWTGLWTVPLIRFGFVPRI